MPFILDGLDTEEYDRNYTDKELFFRIFRYFKPYRKQLVIVVAMLTLNALFATAGPILISESIDRVLTDSSMEMLLLLSSGILILGLAAWLFNFIWQYFSAKVTGNVVLKLREEAFQATIHHDMSFYDRHPAGKLVARITSDTQDFSDIITLVVDAASFFLVVLILLVWVATINLPLTLILILMAPVAVMIALSFRKIARKATRRSRRVNAKINAQIQESISGISVAKSFRREKDVYADFMQNNTQAYQVGLRRGLILNIIFPVMNLASGIGTAILVYFGSMIIRKGSLTPGDWFLFMQTVGLYWWPLISIASFWSQFQDGLSASERVFALIDAEPKVIQKDIINLEELEGKIEFKDVHFNYDGENEVLQGFNLKIKPHETIAFVGHTGAGKSSVAKLITRFYEFQKGELLVDNKNIRDFYLSDYRRFIGLVPQDPFLFDGTVRDNIRYGNPDIDDDKLNEIVKQLGETWIQDLSDGLDTQTGMRGSNLSMGQRQLVALARVLLKNPSIFILDEATASIDPFTETQIQEGLSRVMKNRTAIVIAHRLSTIKNAVRIIVMSEGGIFYP